jgi:predicted nucleic acid-binding protein
VNTYAARIDSFGTSIAALVAQSSALVRMVAPAGVLRVVANDADADADADADDDDDDDDDHVIAAAVAARAELIVTGDRKHMLPTVSHRASPS